MPVQLQKLGHIDNKSWRKRIIFFSQLTFSYKEERVGVLSYQSANNWFIPLHKEKEPTKRLWASLRPVFLKLLFLSIGSTSWSEPSWTSLDSSSSQGRPPMDFRKILTRKSIIVFWTCFTHLETWWTSFGFSVQLTAFIVGLIY